MSTVGRFPVGNGHTCGGCCVSQPLLARNEPCVVGPDGEYGESVRERAAGKQSDRLHRVVGRLVAVEDIGQGRRLDLGPRELFAGNVHDVGKQVRVFGRQGDGALPAVRVPGDSPVPGVVDDIQVRARPVDDIRGDERLRIAIVWRVQAQRVHRGVAELIGDNDDRRQAAVGGRLAVQRCRHERWIGISRLAHQQDHQR